VFPARRKAQAVGPATAPIFPGKDPYLTGGACSDCHGANGEGLAGVYPPLAGSEWVSCPEERLIRIMLHGLQRPVTVGGREFDGALMPGIGWMARSPFNSPDEKITQVFAHIRG
jgi:mono/diheme cytochrome c family protein